MCGTWLRTLHWLNENRIKKRREKSPSSQQESNLSIRIPTCYHLSYSHGHSVHQCLESWLILSSLKQKSFKVGSESQHSKNFLTPLPVFPLSPVGLNLKKAELKIDLKVAVGSMESLHQILSSSYCWVMIQHFNTAQLYGIAGKEKKLCSTGLVA